ncbi:unnamed protein product [Porites lobata]|uniref:Homeobox domain-containing protein n=1 Tax=Porites lobata TaxID=104759 RepID=A0ABN8NUK3_9CNID|nr:unnamed protein product [Porites lobata]
MASFGQDTQTELPPSQSFFKNPFSIRNILNLSEEPQDRCAQNTSNQRFPIIPQVVRPLEFGRYTNVEVGLACYRTTQRLSALRNFPPWLLGTHFMRFLPGATPYLQRRRSQRKKKQRPLFSQIQVHTLELEFARNRYVSEEKRAELATNLSLTETQVKTWFQNRRTKWRKEAKDKLETVLMDSKRRLREDMETADNPNPNPASTTSTQSTPCQGSADQLFIYLDNYSLKPSSSS